MKIKFKLAGIESKISNNESTFGTRLTAKPSVYIMTFVEATGTMQVDITVDQHHKLAVFLAEQNKNQYFEFDFAQPMPPNRLNS